MRRCVSPRVPWASVNGRKSHLDSRGDEKYLDWGSKVDQITTRSTPIEIINRAGKKIVGYLDAPVHSTVPSNLVLIAPAYGETKEHNLFASAYFFFNNLYSFRFDWTDHVGESDGDVFACTLSKMMDDLIALIDYFERTYPEATKGLFASSLAGRVVLKMAAYEPRVKFLICSSPVVDLQYTLEKAYQEDFVGNYVRGQRYGTIDLLGFNIDADSFLADAVRGSFSTLESAVEDARTVKARTIFLAGERDRLVRIDDLRSVLETIQATPKELVCLPNALHQLAENPMICRDALRKTVSFVGSGVGLKQLAVDRVREPDWHELRTKEAGEKAHLREAHSYSKGEERRFWERFLQNYQYILNVHDYWSLLELLYNLLGGAWPGQKILDAGCGNGNYGLFLASKQIYKIHQDPSSLSRTPIRYYGLDFVHEAIRRASAKLMDLQTEFRQKMGLAQQRIDFVKARFVLADLEKDLPLPENFFDRICCNFVVSYLEEPYKALQELYRVLHPGGKIAISTLKPNADLTEVYRNFVSVAESSEEVEQARALLKNVGMVKVKEAMGVYQFYNDKELKEMVRAAGFTAVRCFRSFGEQANVAIGRKMA